MKTRKIVITAALTAALAVIPAASASAGSVTVYDPVHKCDYTVTWTVDSSNPLGTRVASSGTCTG